MNDELDDMKKLWQNVPSQPDLSTIQVQALLAARSKNALTRLRINLYVELGLGILLVLLLFYAAIQAQNEQVRMAIIQGGFLIAPLFIFYYFGIRNLNKDLSMDQSLRQVLKDSIAFWEAALRIYFWGGVLLLPLVFITVRWWRFSAISNSNFQFFTGSTAVIILKAALSWLFVSLLLWGLVRFSYGQHVAKLKKCLDEMDMFE